jgi:hypothetical protein
MVTQQRKADADSLHDDDWLLTSEQMLYMMRHHNPILEAYEREDWGFLRALAASDEYRSAFGAMGWDEAFDRYESTWVDGDPA